jgi:beta-lactamase superfamily II metal-dependent hydrolase
MVTFEAVRAKYGDSILLHYGTDDKPQLVIIDGGPPGVWKDALQPRLDQLRQVRGLEESDPLDIALLMVSHLDEDHISGILNLMRLLNQKRVDEEAPPYDVRKAWVNTFEDLTGEKTGGASFGAAEAAALGASPLGGALVQTSSGIELASVGQGRELRDLIKAMTLEGNMPFKGLATVDSKNNPATIEGLKLTVVAPSQKNIDALQADWEKKVKALLKKKKTAEVAAYVDDSVYNLASIVVLAEIDGKRILLTGDGRGDHTLDGLKAKKLLDAKGRIEVDILKLPHHGSVRDVEIGYFKAIHAKHYVISANGKFDNPDLPTLKMISDARKGDDNFTIWLTNPTDEFVLPNIGKGVQAFFDAEKKAGRKYKVNQRKSKDLSVVINL